MDSRTMLHALGYLAAFITFFKPARTIDRIWNGVQGRSTIDYQYHAAIISCALWEMYGKIIRDEFLVNISIAGFTVQMIYLNSLFFQNMYLNQSFDRAKLYAKHWIIICGEMFALEILTRLVIVSLHPAAFAGTVCAAGTTVISVMKMLSEHNLDQISGDFAVMFANGSLWTAYGLVSSNGYIMVPNLVASVIAMVQIVHYIIRGKPQPQSEERSPDFPDPQLLEGWTLVDEEDDNDYLLVSLKEASSSSRNLGMGTKILVMARSGARTGAAVGKKVKKAAEMVGINSEFVAAAFETFLNPFGFPIALKLVAQILENVAEHSKTGAAFSRATSAGLERVVEMINQRLTHIEVNIRYVTKSQLGIEEEDDFEGPISPDVFFIRLRSSADMLLEQYIHGEYRFSSALSKAAVELIDRVPGTAMVSHLEKAEIDHLYTILWSS